MEHPPKLLNQTLMCTSLREKDSETDENPISDDVGLNCINQTPSTHLSVVRCVPF